MSRRDNQRGMVLLTVLWAIALCSALAMATSTTFRSLVGIVGIDRERVQADALLTAGLEAAAGMVAAMRDAPLVARGTTITLSTGQVRVSVSDEGGRIDIGKAPVELLASLLRYVGAEDDDANVLANRIVDLRGSDRQERRPNEAAKQPASAAAKPDQEMAESDEAEAGSDQRAASASPAPFTDVRQLASIPGMRADWMAAIVPLITVYGSDGVNPLTAPVAVLQALPFVDAARLDTFLEMRRAPLVDPERLAFLLGPTQKYLKVQRRQVVAVDLVAGTVSGYTAKAKVFIVLLPDDKQPYRVLAWNPLSPGVATDTVMLMGAR
ncbi:type II secretion system protein GspK [Bradyrhizobium sp. Arg237L]|uniref:general secretion pathway protein GspK n=1 Tax=Bradyrhizobium sp. Arg237L TaxID=3003352 RepID=UPI00249E42EE|nr:type II secretion system protein GspK [Bradyrhizobium sp. Arg237L]MDI4235737.1 type II secretion system protein GspK [Bradyrhizobium sp. Arg237L]